MAIEGTERQEQNVHLTEMIRFDEKGLVPVIVQDTAGGEVLMVAYMNREALDLTVRTGNAHYYSRSRGKLWLKGETSGNFQKVKEFRFDCDADAVLIKVEQKLAACHEGYRSCFFRRWEEGRGALVDRERLFDPSKVYGN